MEKPRPPLLRGEVHVVVGEIVDAPPGSDHPADVGSHESARRIALARYLPPRLAVGTDRGEPLDVPQDGMEEAGFVNLETDAGQEDALEETAQDGGKVVEPHGIDQRQRLGGAHPLDIGGDLGAIPGGVEIVDERLARHHRIEPFGVEIEVVDLMAAPTQRLDHPPVQRGDETRFERMGEQNEDAHPFSSSFGRRAAPILGDAMRRISALRSRSTVYSPYPRAAARS